MTGETLIGSCRQKETLRFLRLTEDIIFEVEDVNRFIRENVTDTFELWYQYNLRMDCKGAVIFFKGESLRMPIVLEFGDYLVAKSDGSLFKMEHKWFHQHYEIIKR